MKIQIAFPSREMVHAYWAFDMAQLMGCALEDGHQVGIVHSEGTLICDQRTWLAEQAIKMEADWIMWLDTDMRFPRDTLRRLLAHEKPIIGCNYVTRGLPPTPTARELRKKQWLKVPTYQKSTGLQRVTAAGFGAMLTSTEVYAKLPQPWFHFGYVNKTEIIGEDVCFCLAAAEAGYETYIDHDLSKEVRHIGCLEFSHYNYKHWEVEPPSEEQVDQFAADMAARKEAA